MLDVPGLIVGTDPTKLPAGVAPLTLIGVIPPVPHGLNAVVGLK